MPCFTLHKHRFQIFRQVGVKFSGPLNEQTADRPEFQIGMSFNSVSGKSP